MGGGKLLVALALLIALAVPLWAQDWVYIGYDQQGTLYYLDRSSIEDHGSYVTGWIRQDIDETTKSLIQLLTNERPFFMMDLVGAQKGSRQIRYFQSAMYNKNGRQIHSLNPQDIERYGGDQWKYFPPNAMESLVWQALMQAAGIRY